MNVNIIRIESRWEASSYLEDFLSQKGYSPNPVIGFNADGEMNKDWRNIIESKRKESFMFIHGNITFDSFIDWCKAKSHKLALDEVTEDFELVIEDDINIGTLPPCDYMNNVVDNIANREIDVVLFSKEWKRRSDATYLESIVKPYKGLGCYLIRKTAIAKIFETPIHNSMEETLVRLHGQERVKTYLFHKQVAHKRFPSTRTLEPKIHEASLAVSH